MGQQNELPVQASMKLPEGLWKAVKIQAIREGCTVSSYVQRALEGALAGEGAEKKKRRGNGNGDGGGQQ